MLDVIERGMLVCAGSGGGGRGWWSEAVVRKRTNNTMRKGTKRQTMVDKILSRNLKIEQHEPLRKPCELRYSGTRPVTNTFATMV